MSSRGTPLWQRAVAMSGLLVTSPLLAAGAVAIRWSNPGPVLYRSMRAGKDARPFAMHKLRTMRVGADVGGAITSAKDPRVFPVGRLLRRLKIDELPQLANVVVGEMALVGPRPEAMELVEKSYEPWMMETLEVPPGITGLGALHYFQQELALPPDPYDASQAYVRDLLPKKLSLELVYVRNRKLTYELEVILRTVLGVFGSKDPLQRRAQRERFEAEFILSRVGLEVTA